MRNIKSCNSPTNCQPVCLLSLANVKLNTKSEEKLLLRQLSQGYVTAFWKLWEQHQNYLSSRCLQWMQGNYPDAEEALSRAALKAWEKLPNCAGEITNLRAWLIRVTYNLCMDMHRERKRSARDVESIEEMTMGEEEAVPFCFESPESALLRCELGMHIRCAIHALPPRLRDPFILRCCQEMPYQDIAQQLGLSNDNVRKRIQQAREILKKQLNPYLSGLDGSKAEEPKSDQPATSDWETLVVQGCILEPINYRVTATCLEALPHTWYTSPSLLGWR